MILGFGGRRGSGELVDPFFEKLVAGAPKSLRVSLEPPSGLSRVLTSDGRFLPDYTCDGRDIAPIVAVNEIPPNTGGLALVMYDPDAPMGTFIHWLLVAPVDGTSARLTAGSGVEGRNDFGRIGYGGPCPPRGHGEHRYFFLVMALPGPLGLQKGFRVRDLERAVRGRVLSWGYTVGRYSR